MPYQQSEVTAILFDFSQENFHSGNRVPSWSLNSSAASSQYLKSTRKSDKNWNVGGLFFWSYFNKKKKGDGLPWAMSSNVFWFTILSTILHGFEILEMSSPWLNTKNNNKSAVAFYVNIALTKQRKTTTLKSGGNVAPRHSKHAVHTWTTDWRGM